MKSNSQHLLSVFDACVAQATAPLHEQIASLTKENEKWRSRAFALHSDSCRLQAKIRAMLPGPIDFRGLMQKIQACTETGVLSYGHVDNALASVGLKPQEMAQLIGNAPLIAAVDAAIDLVLAKSS
jgi:hypothetical protein